MEHPALPPVVHFDLGAMVAAQQTVLAAFTRLTDEVSETIVNRYRAADGEWCEYPPDDADPIEYPMPRRVR